VNLLALIERCRQDRCFDRLCEAIPYARYLGIRAHMEAGALVTTLEYRQRNIGNPALPALHGGVIGAHLETAAILQLLLQHETDKIPKTINLTVDYLRPGAPRDTFARGVVSKQGRRVANVNVESWQESPGKLIASANCHFLL
jgi:uncharacterized protein (TIGR00369 family)